VVRVHASSVPPAILKLSVTRPVHRDLVGHDDGLAAAKGIPRRSLRREMFSRGGDDQATRS
jgi:hypothetical protein